MQLPAVTVGAPGPDGMKFGPGAWYLAQVQRPPGPLGVPQPRPFRSGLQQAQQPVAPHPVPQGQAFFHRFITIFIQWHKKSTEVGRAPLIHFQKYFFKKGFFRLKLAREFKFYAWIII